MKPRRSRWLLVFPILFVLLLGSVVVAGPRFIQANPDIVINMVDWVRNVVGPAPVSAVENTYYRIVDVYDRLRYQLTGQSTTWELTAPTLDQASATPGPGSVAAAVTSATPTPSAAPGRTAPARATGTPAKMAGAAAVASPTPTPGVSPQHRLSQAAPVAITPDGPPRALIPVITAPALPGEGLWRPLATVGQPAGAPPLIWQTVLRPDPARPFAQVALVAMDLSRSQLHIVPGTREPASNVPPNGLRTGMIPIDAQAGGQLLAAWNGGFKAIHGHYGMMTNGVVWLAAKDGMATAAIDSQGRLTLGAWGRGVKPDGAWVAWRQNNPPLIEDGVVNPDVIKLANTIKWGASLDGAVFIWRSGMGTTPGGRWLIYAAGNSLSVQTLTMALQAAGVNNAMQLDVNATFPRFTTFSPVVQAAKVGGKGVSLPITSIKLINQMAGGPTQFLVPYDRDFFYLTYRPG